MGSRDLSNGKVQLNHGAEITGNVIHPAGSTLNYPSSAGVYGDYKSGGGSTLTLTAGVYVFGSLKAGNGFDLVLDLEADESVEIYVLDGAVFGSISVVSADPAKMLSAEDLYMEV